MRIVVFLLISICISKSQDYKLTCFGIHIADIKQKIYEVGTIEYEVQSRGVADLIWPTNNKYYTVGIAALNVKGMSIMSNSIDLKPYNVDIPDQITEAEQIQAAASMKIKENSELTQNIIKQMILNKEKLSESMVEDINRRAEQEVVAKNMGEAPVHNALAFLEGKDFNIEISS